MNGLLVFSLVSLSLGAGLVGDAHAAEIPEALAARALAGEAGGQGMAELVAHAHALRNRGHLGGVYGIRRATGREEQARALVAWRRAHAEPSTVGKADHWLSDFDLKHSRPALIAWRHRAIYKIKVGETTFYQLKAKNG